MLFFQCFLLFVDLLMPGQNQRFLDEFAFELVIFSFQLFVFQFLGLNLQRVSSFVISISLVGRGGQVGIDTYVTDCCV